MIYSKLNPYAMQRHAGRGPSGGGSSGSGAGTGSGGGGAGAPAGAFLLDTFSSNSSESLEAHVGELGAAWVLNGDVGPTVDGGLLKIGAPPPTAGAWVVCTYYDEDAEQYAADVRFWSDETGFGEVFARASSSVGFQGVASPNGAVLVFTGYAPEESGRAYIVARAWSHTTGFGPVIGTKSGTGGEQAFIGTFSASGDAFIYQDGGDAVGVQWSDTAGFGAEIDRKNDVYYYRVGNYAAPGAVFVGANNEDFSYVQACEWSDVTGFVSVIDELTDVTEPPAGNMPGGVVIMSAPGYKEEAYRWGPAGFGAVFSTLDVDNFGTSVSPTGGAVVSPQWNGDVTFLSARRWNSETGFGEEFSVLDDHGYQLAFFIPIV